MDVSPISAAKTELNAQTFESLGLGKDTFLKMMVAQLQNQDPLNPVENQEFISQMTQFAQLEQIFQLNTMFHDFISMNALQTIGKKVSAYDKEMDVTIEGTVTGVKMTDDDVFVTLNGNLDVPWSQVKQVLA